jgi:hypothetical protein
MQVDQDVGEWVSLSAAADRLGCSLDTIRRRLKRGELPGRQVARPQGFTWQVFLGDCPGPGAHVRSQMPTSSGPDLAPLVALLERTQADLVQATATIAVLQAYGATLAAELACTRERLALLEAPKRPPWWVRLAWWRRA